MATNKKSMLVPVIAEVQRALDILDPKSVHKLHAEIAIQILVETGWNIVPDFNIDAIAKIHREWIRRKAIEKSTRGPFYLLLRAFQSIKESKLIRDDRHKYMMWCESDLFESMSFEEFRSDPHNYVGFRVHGVKKEQVETPAQVKLRREKQNSYSKQKRNTAPPSVFISALIAQASSVDLDAPEKYFAALSGGRVTDIRHEDWLSEPKRYPGREHIDPLAEGRIWFDCMRAFQIHRTHYKGFETTKEARYSLHILADYLFLYLPWWCELNPNANMDCPQSPKAFLRYLFMSRTTLNQEQDSSTLNLPKTLLDLLPLRRPSIDSRNTVVSMLYRFFEFVRTSYSEDDTIAGRNFSNPIKLDFDKVRSRKRSKTDKVPFSEDVFPYLVLYCQATEAFGEYLLQKAYFDDIFATQHNRVKYGYDTAEWGYIPIVKYRGQTYPVKWIPNLYTIAPRDLQSNPNGRPGIYVNGHRINTGTNRRLNIRVPSLSVVRLLLAMVETGLRGQAIQWLDRRTWDVDAKPTALHLLYSWTPKERITSLLVNTDKVKNEPWTTLMTWRVRRSLLSEQYFQEGLADAHSHLEITYENRPNSRFAPVLPLFRSHVNSNPYSDKNYAMKWELLTCGFENFYNSRNSEVNEVDDFLALISWEPDIDETTQSAVRIIEDKDGLREYSALKWKLVSTPHACRATYATLHDGDLEVSEIAMLIGHDNTVTTNHYTVPPVERVKAKVEAIDNKLFPNSYDVEGKGTAFVHAETAGSAVRSAFDADRNSAIASFGFVSGVALWSTRDLDETNNDAITLLRQSPSSAIRWHATHVCPVGNQCPEDIVSRIGGFQRCGLCPLAAKHVDHLPAIAAKKNELKERVRMTAKQIKVLAERKTVQSTIDALHRSMEFDTKELMGWELSTEILHEKLKHLGTAREEYHVDQPEIVRKHLELVTRNASESGFFLQRIADSNAYPLLESPEVRARAAKFIRIILARAGRADDAALLELEPYSELAAFASLVKPMADAKGLQIEDFAAVLDGSVRRSIDFTVRAEAPLLRNK